MIEILALIAVLVIALIIVIKSADVFVDNLVDIGGALGISQIILGVTASAIGTSLPEFGSALIASLTGSTDIGVGCCYWFQHMEHSRYTWYFSNRCRSYKGRFQGNYIETVL